MTVSIASEQDTVRFLEALWYSFGVRLVRSICKAYDLNEEQTEAMEQQLLKPGDWSLHIKPALTV